ncbi:MAG: hypothetical protein ABF313_17075 [Marivita sp.]
MLYQQVKLADVAEHFERLSQVVADVRVKTGREPIDAMPMLEAYAKRGDTAALAWDGDQLVGVTCLGLCHHFISGPEWMPIKVHLVREGYDLGKVGCSHFVYLSPDYWGQWQTFALTEASRRSHPSVTHTLSHTLPSKEMEHWAAKLPGMVDIGLPNPHGGRVFIRAVDPAA